MPALRQALLSDDARSGIAALETLEGIESARNGVTAMARG